MTYDDLKLDDGQILDVLDVARSHGALAMVHAENADCIEWLTKRLEAAGPHRAALARPCAAHAGGARGDAPRHRPVATGGRAHPDRACVRQGSDRADPLGARPRPDRSSPKPARNTCSSPPKTWGIDDSYHGARCICSPPPRDKANQELIWNGLNDGLFTVFSSDHAPFNYDDPDGKKPGGAEVPFRHIPNGIPGLETRLPLLYSEGVLGGRMTRQQLRRTHRHQSGQGLWPAPAQGNHRDRQRRRPGDLGRARADPEQRAAAPRRRLHALRRHAPEGLARPHAQPRRSGVGRQVLSQPCRPRPLPAPAARPR